MILLIALAPALALIYFSLWTDSKKWISFWAFLAALIGVFTGNPIFALVDLLFVVAGYMVAMSLLKGRLESVKNARRDNGAAIYSRVDSPTADQSPSELLDSTPPLSYDQRRAKTASILRKNRSDRNIE
jgi:uncharacterized membrane protein